MHYTVSGSSEKEALSWNETTYREMGTIVTLITSYKGEDRKAGYLRYYELRRGFVSEVFNDMVLRLDRFREERNIKKVSSIIEEISSELVKVGSVVDSVDIDSKIPDLNNQAPSQVVEKVGVDLIEPVQLSLF